MLQMQSTAPAIPRLGVPAYNWWNEALHGVAQGRATVFPQAIGLAATWDTDLMLSGGRHHLHRSAGQVQRRPDSSRPSGPTHSRPFPAAPPD